MTHQFSIYEQNVKHSVRYLRRDTSDASRYFPSMELRMRQIRKSRGWTVEHLASLAGMSKSHLSEIERGVKPFNAHTLAKIASALGVEPVDLIEKKSVNSDVFTLINAFDGLSQEDRASVIRHALALGEDKK
ncbi:hypothetical protein P775_04255 [Puniceibacterium antarcticum]|uniref:HTH cro/C1-type domain-containing protein n=1 Tax=Puniceibacterium antarcticum TaxID=1206336 RepID=A0A2G8RIT6_9RHOB|nr:helix-turn-helix transcriptional regulator [Puniceibacterium antarcticum]PIL21460.1 hypothetical protein P775_04255 [Puniceibacterium antarcticum]